MDRDIIIIGGGPGGYVAAIRGAQLGAKVTLIEKDKLGGTCLNRGCIPTKALFKNAQIIDTLKHCDDFGICVPDYSFDMNKVQCRKNDIVCKLTTGVGQLLKANCVEVLSGTASIVDANTVKYTSEDGTSDELKTKNIIIATGSVATKLTQPGMDLPGVIDTTEALDLDYVPKSIVMIGAGVVGLEFASIFESFGSSVVCLKGSPRLLPGVDEEVGKRLGAYLKKRNIKIEIGVKVKSIEKTENGLKVIAENKKGPAEYEGEIVLVAAGRSINIEGLNLDGVGVLYGPKGIVVDDRFETNVKGIYAIGDVIPGPMLAHVASDEGKAAVENIMGLTGHVNYDAVPSCVFVTPEVASAGLTEEQAKERDIDYITNKFMFAASGKAMTMGETDGFIKVIAERETEKLIGMHILGPHASDLIHEGALAIQQGNTVQDIAETIHAHPTLAESFQEAVLGLTGIAIHQAPKKK